MFTVRGLYETDFPDTMRISQPFEVADDGRKIAVTLSVHTNLKRGGKFLSFYVPACEDVVQVADFLIVNFRQALKMDEETPVKEHIPGDEQSIDSRRIGFSGLLYLYAESGIPHSQTEMLVSRAESVGLQLVIRTPRYAEIQWEQSHPVAFICHDSRDKDELARPLAIELVSIRCPVWYDEFSLNVGDSLRETIERGIRECDKCTVLVTPNFLANRSWAGREFNAIFTREVITKNRVLLPVWMGVTPVKVYEYSPNLAEIKALIWEGDAKNAAHELKRAIEMSKK